MIKNLSDPIGQPKPARTSHAFKVADKIVFNEVDRHAGIIQKYSAYYGVIETIYNEFESTRKVALLESFNDLYLSCMSRSKASDDV